METRMKAQSAMEYLMTYGWAILIIAVVLIALFSLGVFKPSSGSTCLGQAGFICQNAIYTPTGNVVATVGQATGTNWATANIMFVPSGTATSPVNALICGTSGAVNTCNSISGGLASGATSAVTLAATANVPPGTSLAGQLWAQYTITGSSTLYYAQIASVNLAAQ